MASHPHRRDFRRPPRRPEGPESQARREFLWQVFLTAGASLAPAGLMAYTPRLRATGSPFAEAGALGEPDRNGIRLPEGWRSRVVAEAGRMPAAASSYRWHTFPDGGATYPLQDGGWLYANNSEWVFGGVGVLRFDAQGQVVDAYPILQGTQLNCSGGPTPWGSWLSCEERTRGQVYECFPQGTAADAQVKPALGMFAHEAVAVDPVHKVLYLTEDEPDGRFYRFVCSAADWPRGSERPALVDGRLQVMEVANLGPNSLPADHVDVSKPQSVRWVDVALQDHAQAAARQLLAERAPGSIFKGGEGIWFFHGLVYFSTKGDNRIWVYDTIDGTVEAIYHFGSATAPNNVLSGVDAITVTRYGDILVAEDGGDMQLCALLPDGTVKAVLQVVGQDDSEITGPALSPDGRRLYFNSQRGSRRGAGTGITYEILLPR
jgi:secreted PhoX family phosphatase